MNKTECHIDDLEIEYKGEKYIVNCNVEITFTKEPAIAATYAVCGQMLEQAWEAEFNVGKVSVVGDIVLWDMDNNNKDYSITDDEYKYKAIKEVVESQLNGYDFDYFIRSEGF